MLKEDPVFEENRAERSTPVNRPSLFGNVKISHIVSFNSKLNTNFDKTWFKLCLNKSLFFKDSSVKFQPLSSEIYDTDYAKKNDKKIILVTLELSLDLICLIKPLLNDVLFKKFLDREKEIEEMKNLVFEEIKVNISFCESGIHSARFDFRVRKNIETKKLINLLDKTCTFIDEIIFIFLRNELEKNGLISDDILNEHDTYSIVISTDVKKNLDIKKKEIVGIVWKTEEYEDIEDKIVDKFWKKNIPIYKDDIFTITPAAVFMAFGEDYDSDYIKQRIIAIELHCRQRYLLKKIYFHLEELIESVKKKKSEDDLDSARRSIKDVRINIESELEIYRNTIISTVHSFKILFETLNQVFEMDSLYKFVQEKLNVCDTIYTNLQNEKRTFIMDQIQKILTILGFITIVLMILIDVVFGTQTYGKTVILLVMVLIVIIFNKELKKMFVSFLNKI